VYRGARLIKTQRSPCGIRGGKEQTNNQTCAAPKNNNKKQLARLILLIEWQTFGPFVKFDFKYDRQNARCIIVSGGICTATLIKDHLS